MNEPRPDEQLRNESKEMSYSGLSLPVVISVLLLSLVFFFFGGDATLELFTTALATATVAGKFIVLRGLHQEGFLDSPFKLAILVVYMDLLVGFIAVYNIGVLYKIPRFGKKIETMQENGKGILGRNPWMRKVTFFGIIAFVTFPLSGTGAIGGSLFGRLLGLSKRITMLGIALGAIIGAFAMASLAHLFGEKMKMIQGNPVFLFGGITMLGLVVWWLIRNNRRATQRRLAESTEATRQAAIASDPARPAIESRPKTSTRPGSR
ncbi:MAG: small multi-drug export protein [Planctomycetota bacterium]